jgi:hypothetical protein
VERLAAHVSVPRNTETPLRLELHFVRFGGGPWSLLTDDGCIWDTPFDVPLTLQMAVLEVVEKTLDVRSFYYEVNATDPNNRTH